MSDHYSLTLDNANIYAARLQFILNKVQLLPDDVNYADSQLLITTGTQVLDLIKFNDTHPLRSELVGNVVIEYDKINLISKLTKKLLNLPR